MRNVGNLYGMNIPCFISFLTKSKDDLKKCIVYGRIISNSIEIKIAQNIFLSYSKIDLKIVDQLQFFPKP